MYQIYFRTDWTNKEEEYAASKYFDIKNLRTDLEPNRTDPVIYRYSALPYPLELEQDLKNLGLTPLNTYKMHKYVADFDYYKDIEELTFKTWNEDEFVHCNYGGPFIVKGRTNSRKFQFSTLMYAKDKLTAHKIAADLRNDPLIGQQGIIFREYVPLRIREESMDGGPPLVDEWRCFFLGNRLIDWGYYWSQIDRPEDYQPYELTNEYFVNSKGFSLVYKAANVISQHINFFAIDVAQAEDGNWYVVEVNDGSMSGLNTVDPDNFYRRLNKELIGFNYSKSIAI